MLVTSCPECKTTFRISVGILEKAGGQVRCGRCATIFDANGKLREVDEAEVESRPSPEFKFELQPDPEIDSLAEPFDDELPQPENDDELADVGETSEDDGELADVGEPSADDSELADVGEPSRDYSELADVGEPSADDSELAAAHVELAAAHAAPAAAAEAAVENDDAPPALDDAPDWLPPAPGSIERRTWPWAAGVAVATLTLAGQLVHHYRADLVARPAIGPLLALAYAGFGAGLRPRADLDQYQLLDLTAVAEPSGEDQGWLVIETRVHNAGPEVQAYPHIFVRLLDRWEDTVAARYFSPEEYALTSIGNVDRMNVGSTIDAQFMIMDPGPSATGFELELCVESTRGFVCESDEVVD
jgi:predicted Zn finger-like uncharacterized protein